MIKRAIVITAWLVVGHAILGGLYWGLLQIPESNVFMLTLSAVTALAMLVWAGTVEAVGVLGWTHGGSAMSAVAAGARRAAWIVPALVVFGLLWLLTGFCGNWLGAHGTEIEAWLMAKFGWADVSWLHTTLAWILWFVRYVFGVSLGAALLAAGVVEGAAAAVRFAWVKRAFDWRTFLLVTFALLVGFYLPWRYVVYWRSESLPSTWVEPTFATVKLLAVFVVMNTAWAIVLGRAAKQAGPAAGPETAAPATS